MSVYKLNLQNTKTKNMCDERAKEKAKGCGETVKKRLTMQKQPSKRIL